MIAHRKTVPVPGKPHLFSCQMSFRNPKSGVEEYVPAWAALGPHNDIVCKVALWRCGNSIPATCRAAIQGLSCESW